MALRLTEEEFAALQRRRALPCVPAAPSGVSVHDMESGTSSDTLRVPPSVGFRPASAENQPNGRFSGRSGPPQGGRLNKYGNRKVEIDGMKFDSQHEADYYFGVLMPRVKSGELKTLCRQVAFDLPGGIKYIADFVTILPDWRIENVIDAKSAATRKDRVYINKKKQMKACLDIEIQEV